jgi:hypothetical protein
MITIEKKGTCTIFKVTGEVTAHEIILQAVQYMEGEQTETSMWDFSENAKVKITTVEMKGIADSLKKVSTDGKVRKVALVGSKTINIGLAKVFGAFAQMARLPYTYKPFRNINDALKWLEDSSNDQ